MIVDNTGLVQLSRDLAAITVEAPREVRQVVAKGAFNIKRAWRTAWSGHPHIPALPYAVGYDVAVRGAGISAEIGPDKAKAQGPLGNIIEYGTINNPPIPGGGPALEAEEPRFVQALEDLGGRLLDRP